MHSGNGRELRPDGQRPAVLLRCFQGAYGRVEALPAHAHDYGQLTMATGSVEVQTPGATHLVAAHQAVWIPAQVLHTLHMRTDAHVRLLYVNGAGHWPSQPVCCTISPLLEQLIARAVTIGDDSIASAETSALLSLIAAELREEAHGAYTLPMPRNPTLAALCTEVRRDLSVHHELAELGRRFGLSARSVSRRFQAELQLTFGGWCRRARVIEGKARLASGVSVTQVAADLGYETTGAFSAMFRGETGTTPRDYVKRINGEA